MSLMVWRAAVLVASTMKGLRSDAWFFPGGSIQFGCIVGKIGFNFQVPYIKIVIVT